MHLWPFYLIDLSITMRNKLCSLTHSFVFQQAVLSEKPISTARIYICQNSDRQLLQVVVVIMGICRVSVGAIKCFVRGRQLLRKGWIHHHCVLWQFGKVWTGQDKDHKRQHTESLHGVSSGVIELVKRTHQFKYHPPTRTIEKLDLWWPKLTKVVFMIASMQS